MYVPHGHKYTYIITYTTCMHACSLYVRIECGLKDSGHKQTAKGTPLHYFSSSCPVLGLFSPSGFLYTLHSFHNNYLNLALSSFSIPTPVDSCELHNYYLVLSFLFMYSSSGLSTDVFS